MFYIMKKKDVKMFQKDISETIKTLKLIGCIILASIYSLTYAALVMFFFTALEFWGGGFLITSTIIGMTLLLILNKYVFKFGVKCKTYPYKVLLILIPIIMLIVVLYTAYFIGFYEFFTKNYYYIY